MKKALSAVTVPASLLAALRLLALTLLAALPFALPVALAFAVPGALARAAAAPDAPAVSPAPSGAVPEPVLAEALALLAEAARVRAPGQARIETVPGALDARLKLAPCSRVQAHLVAGSPAWGRTRVGLRCADGAVRWNVFLPVQVRVWAPAPVLVAALPAGAALAPAQLGSAVVDWAEGRDAPLGDAQALSGRVLARPLAAGQPLRQADLQARLWFPAGATVQVQAEGAGFVVGGEAVALGPGLEGQPVRLRTEAGRVLNAWAVGPARAELRL